MLLSQQKPLDTDCFVKDELLDTSIQSLLVVRASNFYHSHFKTSYHNLGIMPVSDLFEHPYYRYSKQSQTVSKEFNDHEVILNNMELWKFLNAFQAGNPFVLDLLFGQTVMFNPKISELTSACSQYMYAHYAQWVLLTLAHSPSHAILTNPNNTLLYLKKKELFCNSLKNEIFSLLQQFVFLSTGLYLQEELELRPYLLQEKWLDLDFLLEKHENTRPNNMITLSDRNLIELLQLRKRVASLAREQFHQVPSRRDMNECLSIVRQMRTSQLRRL